MRETILKQAARLRWRHRWVGALDLFLELAFILSLAVAALLLLDRLAFEFGLARPNVTAPWHVAAAFSVAFGLAGIGAAVRLARSIPAAAALWHADKALNADERLLTSVEVAANGEGSPFVPSLIEEAAKPLEGADARRIFPAAPLGYRGGIILSVLTGGLLLLFPPVLVPPPHADFTANLRRGGAPLDVIFESLSIGVIDETSWSFTDGGAAVGPSPPHRFEKPGRYGVTLTVRGPGGTGVETKAGWIEVLDARLPIADFSADPPKGRAPLAVRFKNRSRNAASFRWEFGDETTSDEPEPSHTYAKPGAYTVVLTVGNDFGRDVAVQRDAVRVVAADAPLADFRGMPRKGKAPLDVEFEDLSDGEVVSWEWDFGDLSTPHENRSAARNPAYTYRWPGKYTVRLQVKGPGGEDGKVREKYIEVESEGEGGSGGAGGVAAAQGQSGAPSGGGGAGDQPGHLFFEDPAPRPKVKLDPEAVPLDGTGDLVEKKKWVKVPGVGDGGDERPYTEVFGSYRRAAEDTLDREQIPPPLRDYVKRYFERIRPK